MTVKKPWVRAGVVTAAFAVLALAAVAPGVLAAKGPPPQSETQNVTVTIPERVGIKLSTGSIAIDPTSQPGGSPEYPPDNFPAYYGTSSVPAVVVSVFANKPAGFTVTVAASGTAPPTWLPLSDWYVAAGAEPGDPAPPRTPEGTEPPDSGWKPLNATQTIIDKSAKTSGWDDYNVDFELKFDGDEQPDTISGVILTYTISTKP